MMASLADPALRSGVTILYVDDEPMATKYFARAMAADYPILTAASVDEAIALLSEPYSGIGVLVTDYRMPQRSGGELLRHVEQHCPHVVRIVVTAHADKNLLLDTINAGEIFRILEKPLELNLVRAALRGASARARERSARRESMSAIEETLAFLAHELNTPLATISNFARGIGRRVGAVEPPALQDDIGNAAALMHDNARYCLSVLASFAGSVRQANSAPAAALMRQSSGARQLIVSLLEAYPLTPRQRALIEVEVRQDFPINTLPNCVALVLSSILSNALRALAAHSTPQLRFCVQGGAAPRILIIDNGPGIDPAILERLLVDPVTMHADSGGHGWGMIFCQRIMQSFGGRIEVQSEPGCSTSVTLNFPEMKKERA